MASVRKRSWKARGETKTAWIADYFDQGGKRHIKTFDTKKEANAWLDNTRHEVQQGTHTAESSSITVAEAAKLWIQHGETEGLERSTVIKYRNHVDLHIVPRMGRLKLSQLTTARIQGVRDDLVKELSRPMAKKVLTSIKGILKDAQRRGLVAQNVASPVQIKLRGREERKIAVGVDIPTKEEVNAILAAAEGRWRPLLWTAVFTGLRASELRGLTWDAIDFCEQVLHVRQRADQWGVIGSPKSEAGHRKVPLVAPVLNTLKEWKLACPKADATDESPGRLWLVFPNGEGRPESHSNIVNRGLDPIQITAGVCDPALDSTGKATVGEDGKPVMRARYGMHSLRHFFASWAIERGFTPKRIQDLLGHASIQMTFDVYGHLFPSTEDDHAKFAAGVAAMGVVQ